VIKPENLASIRLFEGAGFVLQDTHDGTVALHAAGGPGAMILGVLQARMSSTRLPGKVMADVAGAPMLGRQVERLRRSQRMDRLVLATSEDPSDDALAAYGERLGLDVVRGPLADVLARFVMALDRNPASEVLVRLTGDCPLTDWRVLDATVDRHLEIGADYTCNVSPRTFPHGLDVEVVRAQALRAAGSEATSGPRPGARHAVPL
jgi:spore coat polysaccharide biosynthesis protein SpsF